MAEQQPNGRKQRGPSRRKPPMPALPRQPRRGRNMMMVVLLVCVGMFVAQLYSTSREAEQVDRTTFLGWMADSTVQIYSMQVRRAAFDIVVSGRRSLTAAERAEEESRPKSVWTMASSSIQQGRPFTTVLLQADHQMLLEWERAKAPLRIEIVHEDASWADRVFAFLPVFLLVAFFWFMMVRQQGGGSGKGMFAFGKSKARMVDGKATKTTFADVAGCDEAKEELGEIVEFLKDPKKFTDLGGRIPKGVLLLGPPGTGKTLLARAVAGEAGRPFFSMSGSDFVEMFVGVGASRVRDLFEQGRKNAPCIVFIDEIDAVGRQRGAGLGGGHDEREQTLNQLLVEMDGFDGNEGVILLAATNRPDVLDRALLRPGRLDRSVVVDAPDARGREAILRVHVAKRKVPLADDVSLETIAKGTPGMSGAELENLVNEAALLAARYDAKQVSMIDFEEAKDKLLMGPERRSRVLSDEERRTTAYHEAGHALVTHLVEHSDVLHKLTIIPRGMALGLTFSLPEKDRYTMDRAYLEDQIAILLAGRCAEWLIFRQRTTGASNDIERATEIARRMVTEWGMNDEMGPIVYRKKKEDVFLGRDISERQDHSEHTAELIDDLVRKTIEAQNDRVEKILAGNRDKLVALAEALLEHEVLDREEILRVLAGEKLESSKKSRQYQAMRDAERRRAERKARAARRGARLTEEEAKRDPELARAVETLAAGSAEAKADDGAGAEKPADDAAEKPAKPDDDNDESSES